MESKHKSLPDVEELLLAEVFFRREEFSARFGNLQTKVSVVAALAAAFIALVITEGPPERQWINLGFGLSLFSALLALVPWWTKEDRIAHLRKEFEAIVILDVKREFVDYLDQKLKQSRRQLNFVAWGFYFSFLTLCISFVCFISKV